MSFQENNRFHLFEFRLSKVGISLLNIQNPVFLETHFIYLKLVEESEI